MTLSDILDQFDLLVETPDGIDKLRQFILQLAVQGRLTEQDPNDEPADQLLECVWKRKKQWLEENDSPRRRTLGDFPDETPFELSSSWSWTRLDDVSTYIQRGKSPNYSEVEDIPVVSQKCIQWEGFQSNRVRFIDPDSLDGYQDYRFLRNGDLLWNSTGVGTVGRVNVYRGELSEYRRVVADSHVTIVRTVNDLVLPDYVFCWIASAYIQSRIDSEMTSGSTKQTELNTTTVRETLLPLPPREEQQRIVATVDWLMDECDALEATQDARRTTQVAAVTSSHEALRTAEDDDDLRTAWNRLESHFDILTSTPASVDELRQTILQLAVQGRLTEQDPSDTPISKLFFEMDKEKVRLDEAGNYRYQKTMPSINGDNASTEVALPPGWGWRRFGDLGKVIGGGTPKKSNAAYWGGDIPWVSPKDMGETYIYDTEDHITELALEESSAKHIPAHSVLIVGRSGILQRILPVAINMVDCTVNQDLKVLTPFKKEMARYIQIMLKGFESFILRELVKTGTTVESLKYTEFQLQPYPIPPLEEQKRIVETVDRLMDECDALEQRLEKAEATSGELFDAMLHHVDDEEEESALA